MVKSFEKSKIAVLALGLMCALAFLINRAPTGAATSLPGNENNLFSGKQVKEIEGYKSWAKVNSMPQLMPERVATACAMILSSAGMIVDGPANPHRNKYFTVYVNDIGRKAMLGQRSPKFPVGSIIVKEKLTAKDSQEPELLTVMIKQKQGFNPSSGDWEYMVLDGTGTKLEGRGNLQNCHSCHIARQKNDYVFRTYLSGEVAGKLK